MGYYSGMAFGAAYAASTDSANVESRLIQQEKE